MLRWPFFGRKVDTVIRPLQDRHLPEAARIHAGFFARAWSVADFSQMLADRSITADCALDGPEKTLFGFAISRLVAPEAELLSIAVSPKQQGKGVGRRLLAAHFARLGAQGAREIFLEVEQGNEPAIQLYRSFGFVQVGERAGYYQKKDGSRATALVMRAELV